MVRSLEMLKNSEKINLGARWFCILNPSTVVKINESVSVIVPGPNPKLCEILNHLKQQRTRIAMDI